MKRWLWGIAGIVLLIVVGGLIYLWAVSEEKPSGESGPEAESLAQEIYDSVNKNAWDSLGYVGWSFRDSRHYLWDRQRNLLEIRWSDFIVLLDPEKVSGVAYSNGREVKDLKREELVQEAYESYCNDAFWFHGFTKLHDPGTKRELVEDEGQEALMVTHTKGGVTPGDSYLWFTDSTGLPTGFKMWVSVIPVGGMYYTWENWDSLYNGALYAKNHQSELASVSIQNVVSGPTLSSVGRDPGVFSPLMEDE